jgi:hypothetical protein
MRSQTPNRKKRKGIKTIKIRGVLVDGSPATDELRELWEHFGYKQLPDGRWYEPKPLRLPDPEFVRRYPYHQTCKACRTPFRSKRYRDAFCPSCDSILKEKQTKIEADLRDLAKVSLASGETALKLVLEAIRCPLCDWDGNTGRYQPLDIPRILEYLPEWIVSSHTHWMKHIFWNRFPCKSKFVGKQAWARHSEELASSRLLDEYARRIPPIIEIDADERDCPESKG